MRSNSERTWVSAVLLILFLSLLPPLSARAAVPPTTCRHEMKSLGGSTAILRTAGDPEQRVDTVEKLIDLLERPKLKVDLELILVEQGLEGFLEKIVQHIKRYRAQMEAKTVPPGTTFEWMAYRRKKDRSPSVLRNACWSGSESFEAWPVDVEHLGKVYSFLVPADCLNLALLGVAPKPPTCKLSIIPTCETDNDTIKVKIDWDGGGRLAWSFDDTTTSRAEAENTDLSESDRETLRRASSGEVVKIGTKVDRLFLEATVSNDSGTGTCMATFQACPPRPPPQPCGAECSIQVAASWEEGNPAGEISVTGTSACDALQVSVEGEPLQVRRDGSRCVASSAKEGNVKASLGATGTLGCTAKCMVTALLERSRKSCCESSWSIRVHGDSLETTGRTFRQSLEGDAAHLKVEVEDGLGIGIEAEYLLSRPDSDEGSRGLGIAVGLHHSSVQAHYALDTPRIWLMDEDAVPIWSLSIGANYHFPIGGRASVYVGPIVGYSSVGDATFSGEYAPFELDFDGTAFYGVGAGLDAYIADCWGVTGGVTYLGFDAEADELQLELDPIVTRFGFIFRF